MPMQSIKHPYEYPINGSTNVHIITNWLIAYTNACTNAYIIDQLNVYTIPYMIVSTYISTIDYLYKCLHPIHLYMAL
jgi:hypothetical protein